MLQVLILPILNILIFLIFTKKFIWQLKYSQTFPIYLNNWFLISYLIALESQVLIMPIKLQTSLFTKLLGWKWIYKNISNNILFMDLQCQRLAERLMFVGSKYASWMTNFFISYTKLVMDVAGFDSVTLCPSNICN